MFCKPSALEVFICKQPSWLQIEILKVIKEEHDRWERGDLTEEEKEMSRFCCELGRNMGKTVDDIAMKVFT